MTTESAVEDRIPLDGLSRLLAVVAVVCLICALSIYAGYLYASLREEAVELETVGNLRDFLLLFYAEARWLTCVFFAGFTLFAPAVCAVMLLWRSAALGGALYCTLSMQSLRPRSTVSLWSMAASSL